MPRPIVQQLPPAPTRGDDFQEFAQKANAHVAALTPWTNDVNDATEWIESTLSGIDQNRQDAESARDAALISEQAAAESAQSAEEGAQQVSEDRQAVEQIFDNAEEDWENRFAAGQEDREERFNNFLIASGYEFVGDYGTGIELAEYNQVVRDTNGEFWRVSGSQSLPYTTTGTGLPEGGAFVTVGDAALRQELDGDVANGQGARLVRGAVIYVDTIADLQALDTSGLVEGQQIVTAGYHNKGDGGGNQYFVVPGGSSDDDGGSFIDIGNGDKQAAGAFPGGRIDQRQFGWTPDNELDLAIIRAANFAKSSGIAFNSYGSVRLSPGDPWEFIVENHKDRNSFLTFSDGVYSNPERRLFRDSGFLGIQSENLGGAVIECRWRLYNCRVDFRGVDLKYSGSSLWLDVSEGFVRLRDTSIDASESSAPMLSQFSHASSLNILAANRDISIVVGNGVDEGFDMDQSWVKAGSGSGVTTTLDYQRTSPLGRLFVIDQGDIRLGSGTRLINSFSGSGEGVGTGIVARRQSNLTLGGESSNESLVKGFSEGISGRDKSTIHVGGKRIFENCLSAIRVVGGAELAIDFNNVSFVDCDNEIVQSGDATHYGTINSITGSINSKIVGDDRNVIAGSADVTINGNRSFSGGVARGEINGTASALIATATSEVNANRSAVLASNRVINNETGSLALGDAAEDPASAANRNIHIFARTGDIEISGSLTQGASFSDFAEMMPNKSPGMLPVGSILALDGGGVRPARESDEIIGVVSGTAAIVAGNDNFCWAGRYMTDEWGRVIYEDVPDPDYEGEGEAPIISVRKQNPNWDPTKEQVSRKDRPAEWTVVGMLGQVFVRVDDSVSAGDRVKPGREPGVGTVSDSKTGLKVMTITQEHDSDKGYAIAKCVINIQP